jgi:glycosyltransferase involved in cell wall biosynthesis
VRVHVVGEADLACRGATHHGLIAARAALFALMGRARTLVCPSLLDAAPGVLFEAAALGCNVVASQNCGNWALCHPDLLARRMHPDAFVHAIGLSLKRPYQARLDTFLGTRSIQRLADVLAVL